MSRQAAIERIDSYLNGGGFLADLERRVAIHTESQEDSQIGELHRYLDNEMEPYLNEMGFSCEKFENPIEGGGPFLIATRHEADDLQTVLSYGHGDVVRGYDDQWREGLKPWSIVKDGDRWYGRGTADNKGQHTINISAMKAVLEERGALGFNVKILIETGEERGSPGLREFCKAEAENLKADVLVASDGPRLSPERPTIFMGSRGVFNFTMRLNMREGGHHSGNWGGLLANPGVILTHAISSIVSPKGEVLLKGLRPPEPMPESVRNAIRDLVIDGGEGAPEIDPDWGEPGFSAGEKVFGWNTFEVLAFTTGTPNKPVNAVPPTAEAVCHIRFVPPTDPNTFLPCVREHLDANGFEMVELIAERECLNATRLDPDHPWAKWVVGSLEETSGRKVDVLPNLGGSLPNDAFSEILGLPTIWVPHSYAACSQHAPNEHILESVSKDALQIMTGLWWDMGDGNTPR